MIGGSIPKLLQIAGETRQAMEQMGENLPPGISIAELESKTSALEQGVADLDALNADRTRMVNNKGDYADDLSGYISKVRSVVRGICGSDSSEYEMLGCTRTSERKRRKKKTNGTI